MSSGQNDISDTIDRMINATTSNGNPSAALMSASASASASGSSVASHQSPFIPSPKWTGPIGGYYFGTSDEGTGYYLDRHHHQQQQHQHQNGKKRTRDENDQHDENGSSSTSRRKARVRFGQDEIQTFTKDNDQNGSANTITSGNGIANTASSTNQIKISPEELLKQAEEEQKSSSAKTLDISRGSQSIKSTILNLEKSISKNQLLRVKFPNDPSKFMNSEVALYEEIELWNDLAASIEYYTLFVNMGAVDSLKALLMHENVDVVLCVVKLFNELLDPDLLASSSNSSSNTGGEDDVNVVGEQLCTLMIAFLGWGKSEEESGKDTKREDNNGLDLIIANLTRLKESEEEELKGIDDILTLVENLLDLDQLGVLKLAPELATSSGEDDTDNNTTSRMTIAFHLTQNSTLTSYLLMKLSQKKLEDWTLTMKLHASEVLASIVQHEDSRRSLKNISALKPYTSMFDDDNDNDKKKGVQKKQPIDGIECLLQAIAVYRKKDPTTEEECEYLENIFNTLAASLLNNDNLTMFIEAQGIELMLRCINEKVHSGYCSIKILFFCVSGPSESYKRAAEVFVDAGGLKSLFPILMGRKSSMPKPAKCSDAGNLDVIRKYAALQKQNRRKGKGEQQKKPSRRMKQVLAANREWFHTLEAHSIQILYGLTRYLDDSSPRDAKLRVASKFIENDGEKCDRLVELCLKYDAKMRQAEYDYFKSDEAEEAEENGIDIDFAAMNAKLKAGGDLFHRLGAIIAFAATGSKRAHEHILEQLRIQNSGIGVIKAAISEFASLINDEGAQQKQLLEYLSAI